MVMGFDSSYRHHAYTPCVCSRARRQHHMRINLPYGEQANAMAIGIPGLNLIMVTKGALTTWNDKEMAAVLSHEQGHINQFHTVIRLGIVAYYGKKVKAAKAEG